MIDRQTIGEILTESVNLIRYTERWREDSAEYGDGSETSLESLWIMRGSINQINAMMILWDCTPGARWRWEELRRQNADLAKKAYAFWEAFWVAQNCFFPRGNEPPATIRASERDWQIFQKLKITQDQLTRSYWRSSYRHL